MPGPAEALSVEPTELRAAVTEVAAASQALSAARWALEAAEHLARDTLSPDRRAEHKMHTFVRQYRSEYELIDESLTAFQGLLEQAAGAYEQLEAAMVEGLAG